MTPMQIANKLITEIARSEAATRAEVEKWGLKIRNRKEAADHGWMVGALVTVTYETSSFDMISAIGRTHSTDGTGYYWEAYSSYMVGLYKV